MLMSTEASRILSDLRDEILRPLPQDDITTDLEVKELNGLNDLNCLNI